MMTMKMVNLTAYTKLHVALELISVFLALEPVLGKNPWDIGTQGI